MRDSWEFHAGRAPISAFTWNSSRDGQLLVLARFDAHPVPSYCRVDLTAVVCDAVADVRVVEPGRRIKVDPGTRPAQVDGDRMQLAMMISNLLANVRVHAGAAAEVGRT